MVKYISLDISGSCTGWCYGEDSTLIDWGKLISKLTKSRSERLSVFHNEIACLMEDFHPDIVLIEKPYLGRNSNVLVSLSKFIAAAEIAVYESISLPIKDEWLIDPKLVKKTLGLRKTKGSTEKKYQSNKLQMVNKINDLYGLRLKYDCKKSKNYNDDDTADAIGIFTVWRMLHDS